jgi:hypothetical protein
MCWSCCFYQTASQNSFNWTKIESDPFDNQLTWKKFPNLQSRILKVSFAQNIEKRNRFSRSLVETLLVFPMIRLIYSRIYCFRCYCFLNHHKFDSSFEFRCRWLNNFDDSKLEKLKQKVAECHIHATFFYRQNHRDSLAPLYRWLNWILSAIPSKNITT